MTVTAPRSDLASHYFYRKNGQLENSLLAFCYSLLAAYMNHTGDNDEGRRAEREEMVRAQLKCRDIRNPRVLETFRRVPRHLFVPERWQRLAYDDHPVSIGEGQTISQPYMVALMTQCLELKGTEKALEVGTGSGYQTAVLAELCARVVTIERFGALSAQAKEILDRLGCTNIKYLVGDGTCGVPEEAPFDRIIVTASAPDVPQPLTEQLADGGIIVIPVGGSFSQDLVVGRKIGGALRSADVCKCVFVPLLGRHGFRE